MAVESRPMRAPAAPLRGWPVIATLGALPILAPIWYFNGLLSVEGLPALWVLLMGSTPPIMLKIFPYIGWSTVIFSTLIEIRVIYRVLKKRSIQGLWGSSLFFDLYDLLTTGLGLYIRLQPEGPFWWAVWFAGTLVITFLFETVISVIWRESRL